MRRLPNSWNKTWTKLVYDRKPRLKLHGLRDARQIGLAFESLEDRRMLWAIPGEFCSTGGGHDGNFNVTTTADGLNPGTLRWAVIQANANPQASIISFQVTGTFALTLTGSENNDAQANDLDVYAIINFFKPSGSTVVIDATAIQQPAFQLFAGACLGASEPIQVIDGVPPTAPPTAVDLANSSVYDTGVSSTDNITNRDNSSAAKNLQFTVTGTISGALVKVYANNGSGPVLIGSATASSGTTNVLTNGTVDIQDGTRTVTATQTESGKPESTSVQTTVVVDTLLPTAPGGLDLTATDTGNSSDNITSDNTPTFNWSAANGTGSSVSGYWWAIDDSTPDSGGTFTTSLTATPTVADGNHTFYVATVDVAGLVSSAASLPFTIDTALPTAPGGLDLTATDTGNPSDNITSDNTPTFNWSAASGTGSSVSGYWWAIDDSTPESGGTFTTSLTATPTVADGNHTFYVATVDVAGLVSSASSLPFTVDTAAPTAPGGLDLVAGSDSGTSSTDNYTNDNTPTFNWSAASGTGSGVSGYWWAVDDSTPESGGTFTTALTATPAVGNGNHTFYVATVDIAGLVSGAANLPFTIDTVAPQITDVLLSGSAWPGQGPNPSPRPPISFRNEGLVGSGTQLAPIPVEGINRVDLAFNEALFNLGATSLQLLSSGPGAPTAAPGGSLGGNVYRWTLSGPLNTGKYALLVNQNGALTDRAGNVLDGEWDNPDSPTDSLSDTFNSGNGSPGGAFRFNFSVLPGDYNRNFAQDAADYVVWRNTEGTSSLIADGNGSGETEDAETFDPNDWHVWRAHFGDVVPVAWPADFALNGFVDLEDYDILKATYGSTVDLTADANANGSVGLEDYLIWADYAGEQNPWIYDPPAPPSDWTAPMYLANQAPRVTNVALSGSISAHPEFEFDNVDGSGEQLRSVPIGGMNTIRVAFSEEVFVDIGDLTLIGLQSQAIPSISEFSYDVETHSATWQFASDLAVGQYLIRLADEVHDLDLEALDGEFTNPWSASELAGYASTFPSGDGEAGGEFRFRFTNLPSDYNGDNATDSADYVVWSANNGATGATTTREGDGTGNGAVDAADYYFWSSQYGYNFNNWPSIEPGAILVSTLADESDGIYTLGNLSLREALALSATTPGADTIEFASNLFASGAGTLTLTFDGPDADTYVDQLTITSDVTITGPGADKLTISRTGSGRLFGINSAVTAKIRDVKITGGAAGYNNGGGIYSEGNLSLDQVALEGNSAYYGGAVYAAVGSLSVANSTIANNSSMYIAGGIYVGSIPATVTNSTVSTNSTGYLGGGVYIYGGTLALNHSTITQNRVNFIDSGAGGGGIYVSASQVTANHSIVADNFRGPGTTIEDNIYGALDSALSSYNLIGTGPSGGLNGGVNGNLVGVTNPGLTALGNYGGPTKTHALLNGSLAIDAGNTSITGAPSTDQRAKSRIADGNDDLFARIDIGAFELAADEFFGSV